MPSRGPTCFLNISFAEATCSFGIDLGAGAEPDLARIFQVQSYPILATIQGEANLRRNLIHECHGPLRRSLTTLRRFLKHDQETMQGSRAFRKVPTDLSKGHILLLQS